MNFRNILFISLIVILLFIAITSVSAADSNSTDMKNNDIIGKENTITHISESSPETHSFSQLNKLINCNNNSDIYLNNNYYFYVDEDSSLVNGIVINHEVTIHGNGHTLDGANLARIFQVNNKNVILKDIKFLNGKTPGQSSGGAINGDCSVINCIFIHNLANLNGGAMYKGTAINCIFKENYANFNAENYASGGAIHDGTAINCIFENNTAEVNGGALSYSKAINSTFISNKAYTSGGAMYKGTAINCTFKDNYAKKDGGAINMGFAENCNFINNFAELCGGAIYDTNATNCNFNNNGVTFDGGAMYDGSAVNCNFTNNYAENGGATFYTKVVLCNFSGNSATLHGNAIYKSIVVQSNFNKDDLYEVKIDNSPILTALNFISTYNSGEKLLFYLKSGDEDITYVKTTIKIYQNNNLIKSTNALTGNGWIVDLMPGIYNAVLSIDTLAGIKTVNILLNLSKSTTIISASNISTSYKKDDYFTINLKNNLGKAISKTSVKVNLGKKTVQYETDENGQIKIATNNLDPNTYIIDITFDGNDMYISSNATSKIIVNKSPTSLELAYTNSSDNINHDLIVILKDGGGNLLVNETLSIDLGGIKNYTTNEKGQIILYSNDLPAGSFKASIKFIENKYYLESNISTTINVVLIPTVISCDGITTRYLSNETFKVTLTDYLGNPLINRQVTVDLGGIKTYITDDKGQFDISTAFLIPKNYIVNITFNGNEKYSSSKNTVNVNVEKCPVEIDIHQVNTRYNIKDDLVVTLKDHYGNIIKDAEISIHFNTTNNYTTDENGQVIIPSEGYLPDTYYIIASFKGNDLYQEKNKTLYIYIFKAYSIISISNTTFEYNQDGYFIINITDSLNRPIPNLKLIINFNGIENYLSDENGQVKISTKGLTPNTYPLSITFNGNNLYYKSSASSDVIIKKATTHISAPTVVATIDENKYLIISLKDGLSKPISNIEVYVDLKGLEKYYITDENGLVKISTKEITAGNYDVNIIFSGNENYTPSNITSKIIINKKTNPITADINVLENDVTILVKVDINAKGYIRFDITGMRNYTFYSPIINGQSTLYCTLLDGAYNVNIVFDENDYYYGNSTSISFTVGKANGELFGESEADETYFDDNSDNGLLLVENVLITQLSKGIEKNNEISLLEKSDSNHTNISFSSNVSYSQNHLMILILILCALALTAFAVKKRS